MSEWSGLLVPQMDGFTGFVPPQGNGTYGVALVGEAPGEQEARDSIPFHPRAPAGSTLDRLLRRAGLDRDKFVIWNTVWSRPPGNYLDGAKYEGEAIASYAPFRDRAFEQYRPRVLVALGNVALKALTSYGGKGAGITQVQGYVCDSPYDGCWVVPTYHPSFIMRGEQHLSGVFIWALQRAVEIARDGFVRKPTRYVTRPSLEDALAFERGYSPEQHFLSYDIETVESSTLDEEEVEDAAEDISYNITRISLCYDASGGYAISLPWQEPFTGIARRMLAGNGPKRVWNGNFDNPRLAAANAPVRGRNYDTMWLWKFLQPTLPRSLGFVAPFYQWTGEPWKMTSSVEPERYSCQDAHALQQIADGVDEHLRQRGIHDLAERHVVDVSTVLHKMSANGLPYSAERAKAFEIELQAKWDERFATLQLRVPDTLKPSKQKAGYKKVPKELTGCVEREFRVLGQDLTDAEKGGLTFSDQEVYAVIRWCLLEPFLPTSPLQVKALIKSFGHKVGTARKTKKETADDDTIKKLLKKCRGSRKPRDLELAELLNLIRECRQLSKVLGTYVKGWRPGADGRIHSTPGFWGKMYRISWRRPNISATIQDKQEEYIASGFRKCVSTPAKRMLIEGDWKGMEAVLVGWFAGDEEYMRLGRLGVHAYMMALTLAEAGKITQADVPQLSWSDTDITAAVKPLKKNFRFEYDQNKHGVHLSNYLGTPFLMNDMFPESFPTQASAKHWQEFYFSTVASKVKDWHKRTLDLASREARLTNPFGYSMPFYEVHRWNARFQRWELGEDAKACIAFLPRDTGAAMLKEALLALDEKHHLADEGVMLATAHDAILGETDENDVDRVGGLFKSVMEAPVAQLNNLVIGVDLKVGPSWHEDMMEGYTLKEALA